MNKQVESPNIDALLNNSNFDDLPQREINNEFLISQFVDVRIEQDIQEKFVLKIQHWIRNKLKKSKAVKRKQFLRQKLQQRLKSIQELLESENRYLKILDKINKEFIPRIQKLIDVNQKQLMFQLFKPLQDFHSKFHLFIKLQEKTYKPEKIIFQDLKQMLPFFKMYFQYCQKYDEAQAMFVASAKLYQIAKTEFSLDQMFYKPVQRLPQYVMLFKQILNYTEPNHPDFENIKQCLNQFESINNENNLKMQQYSEQLMVEKIAKQFSNIALIQPNRKILFTQNLEIIQGQNSQLATVQFFNNFILVHQGDYFIASLQLDKQSFVRMNQQLKYFQDLFTIYGTDGFLIFSSEDREDIVKKTNISLKAPECEADVISVIQRLDKTQKSIYNCYVVQIQIKQLIQRIFFRFGSLEKLEKAAQKCKSFFPKFFKTNFDKSQTKIIEGRILIIQSVIQFMLNQNPSVELLKSINIDPSFIQQQLTVCKSQRNSMMKNQYILETYFNSAKRLPVTQQMPSNNQQLSIKLCSIDEKEMKFGIHEDMRIQDVMNRWAQLQKINYTQDLAISLNYEQFSADLDQDEFIKDLQDFMKRRGSLIFTQAFTKNMTFQIKKQIFLPLQYELLDLIFNDAKFTLVVDQLIKQIKDDLLYLDIVSLEQLAALYVHSELGDSSNISHDLYISLLQRIIPPHKLQQQSMQIWDINVRNNLKNISSGFQALEKMKKYSVLQNQVPPQVQRDSMTSQNESFQSNRVSLLSQKPSSANSSRKASLTLADNQIIVKQPQIQTQFLRDNSQVHIQNQMSQIQSIRKDSQIQIQKQTQPQRKHSQFQSHISQADQRRNSQFQQSQLNQPRKTSIDFSAYFLPFVQELNHVEQFKTKTINIVQKNRQIYKMDIDLNMRHQYLCWLCMIQLMQQSPFYGQSIFAVSVYNKKSSELNENQETLYLQNLPTKVNMGISYQGIQIFLQDQILLKIEYSDITDYFIYPSSLTINFQLMNQEGIQGNKRLRIDSSQSWEMKNMIDLYKYLQYHI